MPNPVYRPRRLRESPLLRRMIRETVLKTDDFILPLFTVHGRGVREPISSMPGQFRLSVDELLKGSRRHRRTGTPQGEPAHGAKSVAKRSRTKKSKRCTAGHFPGLATASMAEKSCLR